MPYRTTDRQIDGAVVTFIDITERKQAAEAVTKARLYSESIVAAVREPLVVLDASLQVRSANPSFHRLFRVNPQELEKRPLFELGAGVRDIPRLQSMLADVLTRNSEIVDFETTMTFDKIGERVMLLNARAIPSLDGQPPLILLAVDDITERKQAEQQELLAIAEDEQRRIGQDLHDDIGQELTGLAMKAETLHEIAVERQIPESALAAEIVAGLDRTRGKVRALSRGMVLLEVDSNGLVSALEELTARLGDLHGVACLFECAHRPVEIDSRRATQLYHIAQEAITNAIKHGHAKVIRVTLEGQESTIKLAIRDDGIGIPRELARPDGMGLRIMSYRAGLIDGKLTITRNELRGTLVSCITSLGIDDHGTHNPEGF
jgi:PAS domain S-box-containing protein